MAPVVKMHCTNSESSMYSGKEMSPVGLGICPDSEIIGVQMIGRDGTKWVNVVKNCKKAWVRSPDMIVLTKEVPMSCRTEEDMIPVIETPINVAPVKVEKTVKAKTQKQPLENPENFENAYEKENSEGILYTVKSDKSGKKKWVKKSEKPKPKAVVVEEDITKKTRKTRAPNSYNIFIGSKLKELRKENPNLETTEYMKQAVALWKNMSDDDKKALKA